MSCLKKVVCIAVGVWFSVGVCSAETPDYRVKLSGDGSMMFGQIVKGKSLTGNGTDNNLDRAWIQEPSLSLRLKSDVNENTRISLELGTWVSYTYAMNSANLTQDFAIDQKVDKTGIGIAEAQGVYTVGGNDAKTFPLQIGAGVYPYKYNPDVRNLGEYLLRASAYPVYFVNWYDAPYYRTTGIHATTHPVEWFNFDALFFSEMYQIPYRDFSLAGVATFKLGKIAEFGTGLDFSRLFSINKATTDPVANPNVTGPAANNNYSIDTVGWDSSGTQPTPILVGKAYSFRSTKFMARAAIDLKELFPSDLFGAEDLKIYGEYAVLGLRNYTTHNVLTYSYYHNMAERSPFMFGINIPTLKMLDVLSLEVEHLKSSMIPGSLYVFGYSMPIPQTAQEASVKLAEWKWSIYSKKTLGAFSFVLQLAQDHYVPTNNNLNSQDRSDVLFQHGDWWWSFKTGYSF